MASGDAGVMLQRFNTFFAIFFCHALWRNLLCACLVLLSVSPILAQDSVFVQDLRLTGDAKRVRLTASVSRVTDVKLMWLRSPDRLVVDVVHGKSVPLSSTGKGLVKTLRNVETGDSVARYVLELAAPALAERAFVLGGHAGSPQLIIDLVATDDATFAHLVQLQTRDMAMSRPAKGDRLDAPAVDNRPLVVLDPGHGGIDPGALAGDVAEKDITLAVASSLRDLLVSRGKIRVAMTRDQDVFLGLDERVRFARKQKADLFLSIHADSMGGYESVRGATLYLGSDRASDAESARIAARENAVDSLGGLRPSALDDDVTNILADLTQRETRIMSHKAAETIIQRLRPVTLVHKKSLRMAGFRVLRAPDFPSALLELGYLSNPDDVKLMISPEWRQRLSEALAQAIEDHLLKETSTRF